MNIVIDSNILFSALIKNSLTRKIILEYNGLFLFPEFIFEEMNKHEIKVLNTSEFMELILK
jgi:predicted nucleic acid-binding protein